jgi:all-trans-retinol dehydrogenase (NAD+)
MRFSIGDVLALLDKTLLNPLVAAVSLLSLHLFTNNKFVLTHVDSWLPYRVQIPPSLRNAVLLVGVGLLLRINRFMSRRALNNGAKAHFDWDREIIVLPTDREALELKLRRSWKPQGQRWW